MWMIWGGAKWLEMIQQNIIIIALPWLLGIGYSLQSQSLVYKIVRNMKEISNFEMRYKKSRNRKTNQLIHQPIFSFM